MANEWEELANRLIEETWGSSTEELPDLVYHYTNANGLVGILSSQSIWASEYRFMNDSSEVNLGLELAEGFINEQYSSRAPQVKREFYDRLKNLLTAPNAESNYVVSFTDRRDDLSQWRGYANDGRGFTIGFDARAIKEMGVQSSAFSFGKVNYNRRIHMDRIRKCIITFIERLEREYTGSKIALNLCSLHCDSVINSVCATYKHSSFRNEREWRIHYYPDEGRVRVRARGLELVPYTVLNPQEEISSPLPIREIGIGPAFKSREYRYAVDKLLEQFNISAEVYIADTPYRLR